MYVYIYIYILHRYTHMYTKNANTSDHSQQHLLKDLGVVLSL